MGGVGLHIFNALLTHRITYIKFCTDLHQLDIFSHRKDLVENAIIYSLASWSHTAWSNGHDVK